MEIQYKKADSVERIQLPAGAHASALASLLNLTQPEAALFCRINTQPSDVTTPLHDGDIVEFVNFDSKEGKELFWHSSAHLLAQAVVRLFPQAQPTIGPAIDEGFYYDFANVTISDADFPAIEAEMERIVQENLKPVRQEFSDASELLHRFAHNPFKQEMIREFASQGSRLSGYAQGEFFDLCRGPHLPSLGKIKACKILKTSGAYWKGDPSKPMLTRIYGISFPDKKQLKEYLHRIEEAKKRDHKILGPRLDLFSLHEEAPGIPFIHPKGMIVWNRLLEYWRACHKKAGYVEVKTPTLMIKALWERSGHWQNYRANMFTSTIEEREFAIKPMNCPGGMLLYRSTSHSYRELPMRVGEIGQVHRYEPSGSLSGLFRVRSFHQDDAHIFMKPEDIQVEILGVLRLVDEMYSTFGLSYTLVLSTRPHQNTIGSDADWEMTTNALKRALEATGKPFAIADGEGAFYGPKIDILVFDALGRTWQCGTVQLDMSLPERFDLEYTDSDGSKKRPVMVHRVIYGSIERFLGALVEFYAGRFPLWLSPSQIYIVPVADRHVAYAEQIARQCQEAGFETFVDISHESVGKKIREAQVQQYNYILTVGDSEEQEKTVAVRTREGTVHNAYQLPAFLSLIEKERMEKRLTSALAGTQNAS